MLSTLVDTTRPRPVTTLRRQLAGALVRSVTFCVLLGSPVVTIYAATTGIDGFGVGTLRVEPVAPHAVDDAEPSRVERLVERHNCWTGDAPADVEIPGGVVMSLVGQGPRYFATDERVGQALDHMFTADDPAIAVVHGFCR
jgi:hypothetical protein